jgi:glycosyltransferase involved in cell wall biosynthesis
MHIGLVIYGSLEALSGGAMYNRRLFDYLKHQGELVEVISQPPASYLACLAHNLQPHWLHKMSRSGFDLLVQDETNHPSLYRSNRSLRAAGGPPIISLVHHLRCSEQHPLRWMPLYHRVEKAYLQTANGFIFNSLTTKKSVEEMLGRELEGVVATPAGDRFSRLPSEQEIIWRCDMSGPLRLFFVGNVIARKGLHTLLEALERIKDLDWELDIAGGLDLEPAYAVAVQARVRAAGLEKRIRFLGPLGASQLQREMLSHQVLVLPSTYEGFGIAYLEGMGFGLVPIATRAGAAGEVFDDAVEGFLIPPGDAPALAARLEELCKSRELLQRMSLAARRRFDQAPGWEDSMRKIHGYLLGFTPDKN